MFSCNIKTNALAFDKKVKARFVFGWIAFIFVNSLYSQTALSSEFFIASKQKLTLEKLSAREIDVIASLSQEALSQIIRVELLDHTQQILGQVWGTVGQENNRLIFTPRFPFDANQRYRATYHLETTTFSEHIAHPFSFSSDNQQPQTLVSQVYPSANTLPENLFKFYIHFSRPMSRGQAYQHIQLLDQNQNKVELPFLELSQELWDPSGQRFTLLFDPGRTKKGIKPNRDMGLPLRQGQRFTLVIDDQWQDADGLPLQQGFQKSFTVGKQDITQPDINKWIISSPKVNSVDTLVIQFDEPLDQAQLENAVWVENSSGEEVKGTLKIDQEMVWQFTPNIPWRENAYKVVANSYLEDQAANSLGRAFEVIRGDKDLVIPETFSRIIDLSR